MSRTLLCTSKYKLNFFLLENCLLSEPQPSILRDIAITHSPSTNNPSLGALFPNYLVPFILHAHSLIWWPKGITFYLFLAPAFLFFFSLLPYLT